METKRKKICHICSYYENVLFDNLVKAQMQEVDARVFFFKPVNSPVQYHADYVDEVGCFRNADRWVFSLKEHKVYKAFRKCYENEHFDIYFAHSLFSNGYIAYRARKDTGVQYIVMVQNTDLNVFFRCRPNLRHIGVKILLQAAKVVFASEAYLDVMLEKYIPGKYRQEIREKSVIIPYGIEEVFYQNRKNAPKTLQDPIRVLSVGLLCRNKNHSALCEAVKELRAEGTDVRLTIIGKVASQPLARSLNRHPFVEIKPFVPKEKLCEEYEENDIFALASITETFGLVYAEALSRGLPIVYSKGQGFDGQFEEGFVGHAVEAKDVQSIKAGIRKVIDNYETLQHRTTEAAERFRWEAITKQYIELYLSI